MADYEDTKVKDLIINNMSQEKFNELKDAGELDPTQLYCTPKVNALTEPYRLGYATSYGGFYMQLTPLANSNVAIDLMRADGTKAFTAWEMNTDGSAKLIGNNKGSITSTTFQDCTYTNATTTVVCKLPNWTYVSGHQGYLSFQTTKMPAASSSLAGIAATYIGDTDETFTKGHTYMVESDGAETPTYTWKDVYEVGGAALPDQTGNAGKFLMTDGTTASWGGYCKVNDSTSYSTVVLDPAGKTTSDIKTNSRIAIAPSGDTGGLCVNLFGAAEGTNAVAIGFAANASHTYSTAIGTSSKSNGWGAVAIGYNAKATAPYAIQIGAGTNSDANTFKVGNNNGNFEMMDANGNVPRERLKNLVEVLPTADNGYTTVKNFGNGYVEITGYASIGTVGAGTGSEVQIDLPAGYTMANANYWVNIAPTSETTMFDFKAEAKARSTTHFMVAYKNEDTVTGLTAAGVYWEVHGMLATTEA